MAGEGIKEIRMRIRSVENITQITHAMHLISTVKLKKAKELAENAQLYLHKLYETAAKIAGHSRDFRSVYNQPRKVHNSLYIVVAGDRGLAGGYNANLLRTAQRDMDHTNPQVITVGNKAADYFKRQSYPVLKQYAGYSEEFTLYVSGHIADYAIGRFLAGEADEIKIVFTNFVSTLVHEPTVLKLLPLDIPHDAQNTPTNFDPSPEEVFRHIIPKYVSGMILSAVMESYASEQGARRAAMETATNSAEEMIRSLSLRYNRARQAAVTQEITEIVAGASEQ